MNGAYNITVCSLPDYERLVAEIYIGGKFVGLISDERGAEQFLLELMPPKRSKHSTTIKLELAVFEMALSEAKERMRKLDRDPAFQLRSKVRPGDAETH
jgi:hypothetical protein